MTRPSTAAAVVLLGLVLGGLGLVVSLLYGAGVPILVCLAAGVLICAGGAALSALPTEDASALAPDSEPGLAQLASFGDLHTLRNRFIGADDVPRFEDRVRRPLADLAAARLRQRHGLDWLAEPRRARELLDPLLWRLLTAPSGQFEPSSAQVETWVTAIEQL